MPDIGFVELSAPGVPTVRLEGNSGLPGQLFFLEDGIEGWYSSPDVKTGVMERGQGDGAHDVPDSLISYATRTVQISFAAWGVDRDDTIRLFDQVRMFVHRNTRVRLVDQSRDCWCEGMVSFEGPATWERDWMQGVLNVVCVRPELLSTVPHSGQMLAHGSDADGSGLSYGPGLLTWWEGEPNDSVSVLAETLAGTSGLRYPLTYMLESNVQNPNQVTLRNDGSSRAYPVFTVSGPMPNGVDLVVEGTGLWLQCSQPVYGTPLVLDSRSRTASVGGLDVSRTLTKRGFPVIEPGDSITVTLRTRGNGWVDAVSYDTWM